jgi:FdhD protein
MTGLIFQRNRGFVMLLSTKYPIINYSKGSEVEVEDTVVAEYLLSITLNGETYKELLCSPDALKALVVGELYSERHIRSISEVIELLIDEEARIASVQLKVVVEDDELEINNQNHKLNSKDSEVKTKLDYDHMLSLFKSFITSSNLFTATGGVHSCALVVGETINYHEDDISRQNALNKVIGACLINNDTLQDKILFTSCRISSEIMTKVIHSGLKIIVSKSAPTDVAIDLAKEYNITLIGFVRGDRMNIYVR